MAPEKLTGSTGLSNLFAWMLTGQGFSTQKFLNKGTFFFSTGQECIDHFNNSLQNNITIITNHLRTHPKAGEKEFSVNPSYVQISDAKVWGQPSHQLTHNPTDKISGEHLSLAEKFTPYFTSEVQQQWVEWLGDLAGRNPSEYRGVRRGWREAIDFIRSFQLVGVKGSGLTTLQLANNLRSLGAFKALEALGFYIPDADPMLTRIAFQYVYNHLQHSLSADDKMVLGFGVIFVEHVLCKVTRWEDRYDAAMNNTSFTVLAEALRNIPPWIQGLNAKDSQAFPLPLALDEMKLHALIDNIINLKD
ncbi:hypothetical protein DFH09DRAFT_1321743 [Mycena vulgaris]|nr:hypothetical protein DFH09DRAFT_1321743 [Mycena vulgaris]